MFSDGTQPTASSNAERAVLASAMASSSQTPVGNAEPHNTATQAPTGLQKLPFELRLRIYKMLVVPRGSIDVDTVPRPGMSPVLIIF